MPRKSQSLEYTLAKQRIQALRDTNKILRSDLRECEYVVNKLHNKLNMYEQVTKNTIDPPSFKRLHYANQSEEQGAVLTVLSDIHGEERIKYEQTNGFNKLTPKITEHRLKLYFNNLMKMTRLTRNGIKLDQLVFGLLGDLIHGFIHEEYHRTNYMTPVVASMWMTELLTQGFKLLLEDGEFKNTTIICKIGNHSRTTHKIYSDEEAKHSYEWAIYHTLALRFPEFNWVIDESYFTYHKVLGQMVRWHHGHAFRYMGGVGGIYIPLMRFILKVNRQRKADMDVIGHWHTRDTLYSGGAIMNGSVCGATPYSIRLGFPVEPPQQQFQIIDAKRGFTINAPIVLE